MYSYNSAILVIMLFLCSECFFIKRTFSLWFPKNHLGIIRTTLAFAHKSNNNKLPTDKFRIIDSISSKEKNNIRKHLVRSFILTSCTLLSITNDGDIAKAKSDSAINPIPLASVVNVNTDIVRKNLLDDRIYKAITLNNGLRVLLISDSKAVRSAAALDVHVGSFSDPKELPGLAHFCEHMSFLGTKKYPKEDEFSSFLSTHGGNSNAYTDSEDTVYVCNIIL